MPRVRDIILATLEAAVLALVAVVALLLIALFV